MLLLATAIPARAEMVHDLGSIRGALRTPEARDVFLEQMDGKPSPDDLGSALPPGLSAKALAALLVPHGDTAPLGTVGAKPWPAQPGRYVALACTGGDGAGKTGVEGCTGLGTAPPLHAYLGVVELGADGAPRLVARPAAVDPAVDWHDSLLPSSPQAVEDPTPADGSAPVPSRYDRLDLAAYRIAPDAPAFGLRASWSDGYAGGFGWHSALLLYAVLDGALRPVLAVPTLAFTDFAADWNNDGSRQHEIDEGVNVVIVSDRLEDGHFDLLVRSRLTRRERLFRWQAATGSYRPVAR